MTASYLVASRQGLFAVQRTRWRLLAEGRFFGIVCAADAVFAFRHGFEPPAGDPDSGCVVRFRWRGTELVEDCLMVTGLDHNCHQLDSFDDAFFLVDTGSQRILEYDRAWHLRAAHQILPPAPRESADHAHLNSIASDGRRIWVMLHNGKSSRPSEIVEFDRQFREIARTGLPCSGCHDIAPLPDGRLLTCLSPRGEIMVGGGETHKIDDLWTRGVALGPEEIAVGSSFYGHRMKRVLLPGFVTFLSPDYKKVGRLYLPAAPTQIRSLEVDPF